MSSLSLPFSFFLFSFQCALFRGFPLGGDEQIRTVDPLLARQVLSQLSYTPRSTRSPASPPFPTSFFKVVGSSGLEPPTSRLSGARSNHLSYEPIFGGDKEARTPDPLLAKQVLSQLSYTPTLSRSVTLFILSSLKGPQN